jgi:hypothetical protein
METMNEYRVDLWEDEIEYDEKGKVVHHPLNSRYFVTLGQDTVSYGYLTFAGHNLDKSSVLSDIKVFYLEFKGDEDTYYREEWANPLRIQVLLRLTGNNRCWYMSIVDRWFKGVNKEISMILGKQSNSIEVKSENPYPLGHGFYSREFFEIPNHFLSEVVNYFWLEAVPGIPIEGYNMGAGKIEVLKQWDARPRDDHLFRDVIDRTFINFYTFPAENRYFVFVTNKLSYAELAHLIGLEELQEQAREISREKK